MSRRRIPKPQMTFPRTNRRLAMGLTVLIAFAVADSRRVMPSTSFIIGTFAVSLILLTATWFRNFRWQQIVHTVGYFASLYCIIILLIAGRFWLALGASLLVLVVILYPSLRYFRGQMRRQIRDGLL